MPREGPPWEVAMGSYLPGRLPGGSPELRAQERWVHVAKGRGRQTNVLLIFVPHLSGVVGVGGNGFATNANGGPLWVLNSLCTRTFPRNPRIEIH